MTLPKRAYDYVSLVAQCLRSLQEVHNKPSSPEALLFRSDHAVKALAPYPALELPFHKCLVQTKDAAAPPMDWLSTRQRRQNSCQGTLSGMDHSKQTVKSHTSATSFVVAPKAFVWSRPIPQAPHSSGSAPARSSPPSQCSWAGWPSSKPPFSCESATSGGCTRSPPRRRTCRGSWMSCLEARRPQVT